MPAVERECTVNVERQVKERTGRWLVMLILLAASGVAFWVWVLQTLWHLLLRLGR